MIINGSKPGYGQQLEQHRHQEIFSFNGNNTNNNRLNVPGISSQNESQYGRNTVQGSSDIDQIMKRYSQGVQNSQSQQGQRNTVGGEGPVRFVDSRPLDENIFMVGRQNESNRMINNSNKFEVNYPNLLDDDTSLMTSMNASQSVNYGNNNNIPQQVGINLAVNPFMKNVEQSMRNDGNDEKGYQPSYDQFHTFDRLDMDNIMQKSGGQSPNFDRVTFGPNYDNFRNSNQPINNISQSQQQQQQQQTQNYYGQQQQQQYQYQPYEPSSQNNPISQQYPNSMQSSLGQFPAVNKTPSFNQSGGNFYNHNINNQSNSYNNINNSAQFNTINAINNSSSQQQQQQFNNNNNNNLLQVPSYNPNQQLNRNNTNTDDVLILQPQDQPKQSITSNNQSKPTKNLNENILDDLNDDDNLIFGNDDDDGLTKQEEHDQRTVQMHAEMSVLNEQVMNMLTTYKTQLDKQSDKKQIKARVQKDAQILNQNYKEILNKFNDLSVHDVSMISANSQSRSNVSQNASFLPGNTKKEREINVMMNLVEQFLTKFDGESSKNNNNNNDNDRNSQVVQQQQQQQTKESNNQRKTEQQQQYQQQISQQPQPQLNIIPQNIYQQQTKVDSFQPSNTVNNIYQPKKVEVVSSVNPYVIEKNPYQYTNPITTTITTNNNNINLNQNNYLNIQQPNDINLRNQSVIPQSQTNQYVPVNVFAGDNRESLRPVEIKKLVELHSQHTNSSDNPFSPRMSSNGQFANSNVKDQFNFQNLSDEREKVKRADIHTGYQQYDQVINGNSQNSTVAANSNSSGRSTLTLPAGNIFDNPSSSNNNTYAQLDLGSNQGVIHNPNNNNNNNNNNLGYVPSQPSYWLPTTTTQPISSPYLTPTIPSSQVSQQPLSVPQVPLTQLPSGYQQSYTNQTYQIIQNPQLVQPAITPGQDTNNQLQKQPQRIDIYCANCDKYFADEQFMSHAKNCDKEQAARETSSLEDTFYNLEQSVQVMGKLDLKINKISMNFQNTLQLQDLPQTRSILQETIQDLAITLKAEHSSVVKQILKKIEAHLKSLNPSSSSTTPDTSLKLYLYLKRVSNILRQKETALDQSAMLKEISTLYGNKNNSSGNKLQQQPQVPNYYAPRMSYQPQPTSFTAQVPFTRNTVSHNQEIEKKSKFYDVAAEIKSQLPPNSAGAHFLISELYEEARNIDPSQWKSFLQNKYNQNKGK